MTPRAFATDVVRRLRDAGYEALFAGGCVRDQLLGDEPRDFDVATSARPDAVQQLFRRTVAVGAAFGVIEVLGPDRLAVEVASFRCDGPYSDGRHPDWVAFASPREDAQRRDFTVNGMFFDPLGGRLIDFVGGEADLRDRLLRAIGEPAQRFREDRLRLLRAARFAARLDFSIEPVTWAAVTSMAGEVTSVSGERIADELRKLLTHPSRARGVRLLAESGLLAAVLPECEGGLDAVDRLDGAPSFPLALAALWGSADGRRFGAAAGRLRLSNAERDHVAWLVRHRRALAQPEGLPPHVLKPLLAHAAAPELISLHRSTGHAAAADYCEQKLQEWPADILNPPPLVTGEDLIALGLPPGRRFKDILDAVRRDQLDGRCATREEALTLVRKLAA